MFISRLKSAKTWAYPSTHLDHFSAVAPHLFEGALLLMLIELLVVLTGSDVQLVLGLGPWQIEWLGTCLCICQKL